MDYEYWNKYYEKKVAPIEPSDFSKKVLEYLNKKGTLLELGCGNGRDALFFGRNNIDVVAIDQSDSVISYLQENNKYENIEFIIDNFVNTELFINRKFEYVYSRFTIHSISKEEEDKVIKNVYKALNNDGLFFIEVRSVKDDLFGLGEKVGYNEYIYNSHYRRFLVIEELVNDLIKEGFEIIFAKESDQYAVYKDEKPMVIRIVAKK